MTTDEILAHLDTLGADVHLKRESFSLNKTKWFCYISVSDKNATSVNTGRRGNCGPDALQAAYAAILPVLEKGMNLRQLSAPSFEAKPSVNPDIPF